MHPRRESNSSARLARRCEIHSVPDGFFAHLSRSFRGDATHRTRNLEIPRCAIAHLWPAPFGASRNDGIRGGSKATDFARRANVPHPVGIAETPKSVASFHSSCFHKEGRFAIVTNVGSGMRWTQSIEARSSRGRAISLRTAKSYGPGAPTLASSWR